MTAPVAITTNVVTPASAPLPPRLGRAERVLRRLWQRRQGRLAIAGLAILGACALLAPWLAPHDPSAQLDIVALKSQPPSPAHPFGTDPFSRDVLSRVLYGARVSLAVGVLAAAVSITIGTAYGLVAGYRGGRTDALMMRLVDAALSVPRVLLLLAVVALWGTLPFAPFVLVLGLTQ